MESIRKAVERAKGSRPALPQAQDLDATSVLQPQHHSEFIAPSAPHYLGKEVALNAVHLEANRIIAHDISDPRTKSFDMLRTQVLQSMDLKSWQVLGVTSPTPGCGKTVLAINLALSIARLQNRPVLLVDVDLQKPQVANYLGLNSLPGVLSILEGRTQFSDALVQARIKNLTISVLPCEAATLQSSELMASNAMDAIIQQIKRDYKDCIVIFDLPPVLIGDDVITVLPQLDCVLFVAAMGTTTVSDIKESNKHLESTSIVRFVLNKSSEMPVKYYYSHYAKPSKQGRAKRRA